MDIKNARKFKTPEILIHEDATWRCGPYPNLCANRHPKTLGPGYTAADNHAGTIRAQMYASGFAAPLGRIKFLPSFFET